MINNTLMPHYKTIEPVKYDRKKHNMSFKNAFNGILLAFRTQPNFRFHVFFFVMAVVCGFLYKISTVEFIAIILISAMIMSLEMVNTAVEAIGDELSEGEFSRLVGIAKDVSAGGVLLCAFCAVLLGIIIFVPKFIYLLGIVN